MKLVWDESAWSGHLRVQDRGVLERINALISDVARDGNEGIGEPEPLKHGFHGYWSRAVEPVRCPVCHVDVFFSGGGLPAGCRMHHCVLRVYA